MNQRTEKIFNQAKKSAKEHSLLDKFPAFFRMIKQWRAGMYKPKKRNILLTTLAIIYVFIPEFTDLIPFIGWADEVAAIGFAITRIMKELDLFLLWEKKQTNPTIIDTEAIVEE